MPSQSRIKLTQNKADIDRLAQIHEAIAKKTVGRKYGVEPLNKSMIVLTCAVWEAFVEDLCEEAVSHLASHLPNPAGLPEFVRHLIGKRLAEDLKTDKGAVWTAVGKGWAQVLTDNLTHVKEQRWEGNQFNTPKSWSVDLLFKDSLGVDKLSDSWTWGPANAETNRSRLNKYVSLRGDVAHRLASGTKINKPACEDFLGLVVRLADASDTAVNNHVNQLTGVPLF